MTASNPSPAGVELMKAFVEGSPFANTLGLRPATIEPDHVILEMPFKEAIVTIGDVVHGGAISSLVDTAATAAAWTAVEDPGGARGTTVALSITFVAAARGQDVSADARVVRRGKTICFCEVDVVDAGGTLVAKGLVTYKLG
jgi:uncharacterized protein (TIGR00369 family)